MMNTFNYGDKVKLTVKGFNHLAVENNKNVNFEMKFEVSSMIASINPDKWLDRIEITTNQVRYWVDSDMIEKV